MSFIRLSLGPCRSNRHLVSQYHRSLEERRRCCMKPCFCQLGSFIGFFKLLLCFPKLGQVQSSNFFSLLNLSLVCFDLLLKFSSKLGHPVLVFCLRQSGKQAPCNGVQTSGIP